MSNKNLFHNLSIKTSALLILSVCLLAWPSAWPSSRTTTDFNAPSLNGEEAVDYLKQQGMYSSLAEAMAAARYGVYETHHTRYSQPGERFYANNPAQGYRAFFSEDKVRLSMRQCDSDQLEWAMKLTGYGYGERIIELRPGKLSINGNRVEIARAAGNSNRPSTTGQHPLLTEWYVNDKQGLEQGFTLLTAPGEPGEGEWLSLRMEVSGNLSSEAEAEGKAVTLRDKSGRAALSYNKLVAFDARGRELASRMKVSGSAVWLEVDDREALYPLTIDPIFSQLKKLTASDGAALDRFGNSVSVSGDTVVVGAPGDDDNGNNSGSVYLFERNQGGADNWGQVTKITPFDGAALDQFGVSVAISNDTVVVGANVKNAAYVFKRNQGGADQWGQVKKLVGADVIAGDLFGVSVSVSCDTVVIGAAAKGAAYIFGRNQGGTNVWGQIAKLVPSDGALFFGRSVAISYDTIVVGTHLDNNFTGSAYLFARNQGGANNWGEVAKITASDGAVGDEFGLSVAISGDTVVVGAFTDDDDGSSSGSAYLFERNQGGADQWGQVKKLTASDSAAGDLFGFSVAISADTVVVGAHSGDGIVQDSGSAYVFARNQGGANNWGEVAKITASDGAAGDHFGRSVAISGDTIVVGAERGDGNAQDSGSTYLFVQKCNQWVEQQKVGTGVNGFGGSVSISGNTAVVSDLLDDDFGSHSGAVYVLERNQGGADHWGQVTKLTASDAASGDRFGNSISISCDTLVVGAIFKNNFRGSAYVFARNQGGADNWGEIKKLTAFDGANFDVFGASVSISGDEVVVGAPGDDDNGSASGSAYVFLRNRGGADNWGLASKIKAFDGAAGDQFGHSVAISCSRVVVGAVSDDANGIGSGSAYIFEPIVTIIVSQWVQVKKLTASDGTAGDAFGGAVAIDCDTVVIGAASDDHNGDESGSAYLFERNQGGAGNWGQVRKLTASDNAAGDQFAISVAISANTIVVGAEGDDDNGDLSGSAYLFERNQGGADNWGQLSKITATDGAAGDRFGGVSSAQGSGQGVAISGDTIIVGARIAGSAYLFTTTCSAQQQIQAIIQMVKDLSIQRALTKVQADDLDARLTAAILMLDQGNARAACNQLGDFINQVNALVHARVLPPGQGQPLIEAAVAVRAGIC